MKLLGVSNQSIQSVLSSFKGVKHRTQFVKELNGRRFYNDSKATTPDASITALKAFEPGTAIFIVGGYDKHLDMRPMYEALATRAKAVLCIGAMGPTIAANLAKIHTQGSPPVYTCNDLATAVKLARQSAQPGDTILLSPGCASYDQFPNFEKRGELFAELARSA